MSSASFDFTVQETDIQGHVRITDCYVEEPCANLGLPVPGLLYWGSESEGHCGKGSREKRETERDQETKRSRQTQRHECGEIATDTFDLE